MSRATCPRPSPSCTVPLFILTLILATSRPAVAAQPVAGAEGVPTAESASYFYNLGINHFIRRDYQQAYRAFSTGYAGITGDDGGISPFATVIQYWRAAMLIAMHDEEGARQLLRPILLAARRPLSANTGGDIVRALERVQGPIRRRILEIETQVLGGSGQTTISGAPPCPTTPCRTCCAW